MGPFPVVLVRRADNNFYGEQSLMIDVVFSDSEKGAMRCGQHFTKDIGGATAIAVIGTNGEQPTQEEIDVALSDVKRRQEQEQRNGKSLGGKAEDVVGLSFALDIGDIESSVIDDSRRDLIAQFLNANPWNELNEMEESINHYWENCVSDLNKLLIKAKAGEPIRIWYSDAPYSKCGFYNTVYQLNKFGCHISAVKLPDYMPIGDQEVKEIVSWAEVSPGEFAYYLPLEFEVPESMQKTIIMEWEKLKQENSPLRIVLNGKIHSEKLDFYDRFIRKEIPDGNFKVGQLIGFVLGRNMLGIGDWLIAQRIKKMIESGELIVIHKDSAFYGTTLKRA